MPRLRIIILGMSPSSPSFVNIYMVRMELSNDHSDFAQLDRSQGNWLSHPLFRTHCYMRSATGGATSIRYGWDGWIVRNFSDYMMPVISDGSGVGGTPWEDGRHRFIAERRFPFRGRRTRTLDGSPGEFLNYDSQETARTVVIVQWRRLRRLSSNH